MNKEKNRIAAVKNKALPLLVSAALLLCLFPLSAGAAGLEDAVFPAWYSFPDCGLSLLNDDYHVDEQFYRDAFGPLKGSFLYDAYEGGGSHGLCYGIAFVNAAILTGEPAVDTFLAPDGTAYRTADELKKGTVCDALGLPLLSLIKYAYVMQASSAVPVNFSLTKNDARGLRDAVYDFVYNGGAPVAVGLLGRSSHEVLAVGLLGDEDIVINDSNDPTQLYVMDFTGDRWEYRCAGLSWRSGEDSFDYCTDVTGVIDAVLRGTAERRCADAEYVYDAAREESGDTDITCPGLIRSDEDNMLLLAPEAFRVTPKEEMLSLGKSGCGIIESDYLFDFLWAAADTAVVVQNVGAQTRSVAALGNETGVIASVPPGDPAAVTLAGDTPALLLNGRDGEEVLFSFITLDADGNRELCRVQGELDGQEAFALLRDGVLSVSGLRGVSAEIEKPGFGGTKQVRAERGELLLSGSYDAGLTVTVMGDADGDGRVTSADARITLRCSVELERIADYDAAAADIDHDDRITSADARLILRRSVGLAD